MGEKRTDLETCDYYDCYQAPPTPLPEMTEEAE